MGVSMRFRFAVGILVIALAISAFSLGVSWPVSAQGKTKLLVLFSNTIPFDAEGMINGFGGSIVHQIPEIGAVVVEASESSAGDLAAALRSQPGVQAVGQDLEAEVAAPQDFATEGADSFILEGHVPINFPFNGAASDSMYTTDQWSLQRIGANASTWALSMGEGVKIAFLDTGVSTTHPDIQPNLDLAVSLVNVNEDNPKCDDGTAIDQVGHGTLVASLAAGAKGPGTGLVIGVAPKAKIRSYKVIRRVAASRLPPGVPDTSFTRCLFGGGAGNVSWILQGLVQAVNDGADIISMSFGITISKTDVDEVRTIYTALLRATNHAAANGVVLVASAGNSGLNMNALDPVMHLPSELPHVINVVATTNPLVPPAGLATGVDYLANYSNFGSSLHGVASPGGQAPVVMPLTRLVRGACSPGVPGKGVGLPPVNTFGCFSLFSPSFMFNHSYYVRTTGTSLAAPHVAGVAALIRAANPDLTSSQIRTILQQTAEDIGKRGYDQEFNFGLVDADAAVQRALAK